jgi:hypothetical protein
MNREEREKSFQIALDVLDTGYTDSEPGPYLAKLFRATINEEHEYAKQANCPPTDTREILIEAMEKVSKELTAFRAELDSIDR